MMKNILYSFIIKEFLLKRGSRNVIHTEKPTALIMIFGATGDLAKRKLFPSLYRLYQKGKLSERFAVVGVARQTDILFSANLSIKRSSHKKS